MALFPDGKLDQKRSTKMAKKHNIFITVKTIELHTLDTKLWSCNDELEKMVLGINL